MNGVFESIKQGLSEAVEYERGVLEGVKVDKSADEKPSGVNRRINPRRPPSPDASAGPL